LLCPAPTAAVFVGSVEVFSCCVRAAGANPAFAGSPSAAAVLPSLTAQKAGLSLSSTESGELGGWGRGRADTHALFLGAYLERLKNQLPNLGARSC